MRVRRRTLRSYSGFLLVIAALVVLALLFLRKENSVNMPEKFGLGRTASDAEIRKLDIDVRADGKGLPKGRGTVAAGKLIYAQKCLMCHGDGSKSEVKLPGEPLFIHDESAGKVKTIGNYWPYASTIFDYVRRAMPYNAPGSLSNQEVYDLTAYLLYENKLLKANEAITETTLPKIVMPAKKLYVTADR